MLIRDYPFVADVAEDYLRRKKAFFNPKDVVDFLKLLIHRSGYPIPQVYDGSTKTKTVRTKAFRLLYIVYCYLTLCYAVKKKKTLAKI